MGDIERLLVKTARDLNASTEMQACKTRIWRTIQAEHNHPKYEGKKREKILCTERSTEDHYVGEHQEESEFRG